MRPNLDEKRAPVTRPVAEMAQHSAKVEKIRQRRAQGRPVLSRERLARLVNYDPQTGAFTHALSRGGRKAGDEAGTIGPDGYRLIFVDYFQWRASHLAWLYMKGELPPAGLLIDHRDGSRANDRWSNLRLATHAQNSWNRRPGRRNKTGRIGVHPISEKLFGAAIGVAGRSISLGRFACLDAAIEARCAAERHYFGDFAVQTSAITIKGGNS